MSKDIFISYSRRDQEFVVRLATDLDAQVAGVWFDQATIQLGQKWHKEIMDGIRECKAFILALSPDAIKSRYVREEVHKALELGKTIFPDFGAHGPSGVLVDVLFPKMETFIDTHY